MSKCISSHGEYSEHELAGAGSERFTCRRRWALDEDVIVAAIAAAEAEVLTLREQRDKAWPGVITTATFSRGDVYRDADCDVECECVCHDEPPLPEGTYVTVKLDRDESIGLRRVRVLDDGPRASGVTRDGQ